jgi:hypothetical protein
MLKTSQAARELMKLVKDHPNNFRSNVECPGLMVVMQTVDVIAIYVSHNADSSHLEICWSECYSKRQQS